MLLLFSPMVGNVSVILLVQFVIIHITSIHNKYFFSFIVGNLSVILLVKFVMLYQISSVCNKCFVYSLSYGRESISYSTS